MNGLLLSDAFGHHTWATLVLLDTCAALTEGQLASDVPGTYGSIIDTLRHTVGADVGYLGVLAPGEVPPLEDEETSTIADLHRTMTACGEAWARLCERELDPALEMVRHRPDGTTSSAPQSIRLAQAIHHGTDHRSQVCTALTALGIEPPEIDVWAFAWKDGRLSET